MKTAAIYARVSSERQKEEKTIASQTAALMEHAQSCGYTVPCEWIFQDEGYSGSVLVRPGLEHLRGLNALYKLHLTRTKVTEKGVARLRKARPRAKIEYSPDAPEEGR